MAGPITRRQFMHGNLRPGHAPLRPPWALPEEAFVEHCTRCGDCLRQCPEALLSTDSAGFPRVDFSQATCTFCAACVEACPHAALTQPSCPSQGVPSPWSAKAIVDDSCLTLQGVYCEVCRDRCAVRAIQFRPSVGRAAYPYIDTYTCTGCGACIRDCPTGAIHVVRPVEGEGACI